MGKDRREFSTEAALCASRGAGTPARDGGSEHYWTITKKKDASIFFCRSILVQKKKKGRCVSALFFDLTGLYTFSTGLDLHRFPVNDRFNGLEVGEKPSFGYTGDALAYAAFTFSHTPAAYRSARYRFLSANVAFSCHGKPFLL
jgi:hypothetical protein